MQDGVPGGSEILQRQEHLHLLLARGVPRFVQHQQHLQIIEAALFALSLATFGCGSPKTASALPPEDGVTATGACNTIFGVPSPDPGFHVGECNAIEYPTNPPCAGHHYAVWADYKEYPETIAPGYWVHSIEHGGTAFLYGCDPASDPGCSELVVDMRTYMTGLPQDPDCTPPTRNRTLMLPYPTLGAPFAAVVWGHYLRADCFDSSLVTALIETYYGNNYEDTCAAGFDPTDAAPNCGTP